jgi:hypothetical protein
LIGRDCHGEHRMPKHPRELPLVVATLFAFVTWWCELQRIKFDFIDSTWSASPLPVMRQINSPKVWIQ